MSTETKLKVGLDASELERAFSALIKKLQSDADKLNLKGSGGKNAAEKTSSDVFKDNLETTRSKEKSARLDQQAVQIANRALDEKKRKLDEISRKEAESVKNEKEKAYWARERNKAEEDYNSILKTRDRLQSSLNPKGGKPNPSPAGGSATGETANGGIKIPKGGITSLGGLAEFLGAPGAVLAGIATAVAGIKGAEGTRRFFAESQFRNREIEAQTFQTEGQGGQRLNSIFNGGGLEDFQFTNQRLKASQYAQDKIGARYNNSLSFVPKGKSQLLDYDNEVMGAFTSGNFSQGFTGIGGFFSDSLKKEFQNTKQQETADAQQKQFNAIKNGPEEALRTAVADRFRQTYKSDLAIQRQLGLNDEQLRGNGLGLGNTGLYGKANEAGFLDEQARGAAGNIISAGGSTRSARGNAITALQAERNLDITNASQVLGKLSGSIGSETGSKDAFVKILAEGTRVGLDGSQYREENRKFIESAASIVGQSGATSNQGLDQVMELVGKFFGSDKTTKGIEAGQNAYDLYRQKSMEQGGPTGAMRAAGIMKDTALSKLDTFSRAALFNTPTDQLTSDNPQVRYWAKKAGVSPEELIERANKVTANSQNKFDQSDIGIKNLQKIKKDLGIKSFSDVDSLDPYRKQLALEAYGQAQTATNVENSVLAQNQKASLAYIDAQASGDSKGQMKALEDAKRAQVDANNPTRAGDLANSIQAQYDKVFNNMFSSIKDQVAPTKQAVDALGENFKRLVTIINTAASAADRANALNKLGNSIGIPTQAPNQQSAGPPSPNGGH